MNLRPSWHPRAKRWPDLRRMKRDPYVEPHQHTVRYQRDPWWDGYTATCDCGATGLLSMRDACGAEKPWIDMVIWD